VGGGGSGVAGDGRYPPKARGKSGAIARKEGFKSSSSGGGGTNRNRWGPLHGEDQSLDRGKYYTYCEKTRITSSGGCMDQWRGYCRRARGATGRPGVKLVKGWEVASGRSYCSFGQRESRQLAGRGP